MSLSLRNLCKVSKKKKAFIVYIVGVALAGVFCTGPHVRKEASWPSVFSATEEAVQGC